MIEVGVVAPDFQNRLNSLGKSLDKSDVYIIKLNVVAPNHYGSSEALFVSATPMPFSRFCSRNSSKEKSLYIPCQFWRFFDPKIRKLI